MKQRYDERLNKWVDLRKATTAETRALVLEALARTDEDGNRKVFQVSRYGLWNDEVTANPNQVRYALEQLKDEGAVRKQSWSGRVEWNLDTAEDKAKRAEQHRKYEEDKAAADEVKARLQALGVVPLRQRFDGDDQVLLRASDLLRMLKGVQ